MTEKDIVGGYVKQYLEENPELVRQQGIAKDRAKMENYLREIAAPQPRSPVEAYDLPIQQVDVAMPLQTVFFNDPSVAPQLPPYPTPPGGTTPDGFPTDPGKYIYVVDDGGDGSFFKVDTFTVYDCSTGMSIAREVFSVPVPGP